MHTLTTKQLHEALFPLPPATCLNIFYSVSFIVVFYIAIYPPDVLFYLHPPSPTPCTKESLQVNARTAPTLCAHTHTQPAAHGPGAPIPRPTPLP